MVPERLRLCLARPRRSMCAIVPELDSSIDVRASEAGGPGCLGGLAMVVVIIERSEARPKQGLGNKGGSHSGRGRGCWQKMSLSHVEECQVRAN